MSFVSLHTHADIWLKKTQHSYVILFHVQKHVPQKHQTGNQQRERKIKSIKVYSVKLVTLIFQVSSGPCMNFSTATHTLSHLAFRAAGGWQFQDLVTRYSQVTVVQKFKEDFGSNSTCELRCCSQVCEGSKGIYFFSITKTTPAKCRWILPVNGYMFFVTNSSVSLFIEVLKPQVRSHQL